ncbi:hypothetical protein L6164_033571 [Bauhinia variegata]|uniref:Uncharacterized protein n=1 Tax=Bauhinia variegata TaxID=167791 RepID=A0ACB9KSZ3_BAUVA|nr:hypothetical protein L6164_033571 [Bauhinia variegata]
MKGIDIFCVSQASTAICLSMDQASCSSSSNTIQLGGRAIDRHNPIITDSRRRTPKEAINTPCSSSQPPIDPKPYQHLHGKSKKQSSSNQSEKNKKNSTKGHDQKKKSSEANSREHITNNYSSQPISSVLRRSWVKPPANLLTPPGSSRYLLNDSAFLDSLSDHEPVLALTPVDSKKKAPLVHDADHASKSTPSTSSRPKSAPSDQVVVLRVSLHCKGCEGKVRKHLSRMEGVTSFNIDFAAKKVTVVGDVTPLSVLASVSKVKSAQFWPVSAPAVGSAVAETKK